MCRDQILSNDVKLHCPSMEFIFLQNGIMKFMKYNIYIYIYTFTNFNRMRILIAYFVIKFLTEIYFSILSFPKIYIFLLSINRMKLNYKFYCRKIKIGKLQLVRFIDYLTFFMEKKFNPLRNRY